MGVRGRHLLVVAPAAVLVAAAIWSGCSSSGEGGGAPAADTGSDAPLVGACLPDKAAVYQTYCPESKSFVDITGACGIECVLAANRHEETPTCVQDCLRKATYGKIGDPCLECNASLVACARAHCLGECAPGPSTAKCLDCMCGHNISDGGGPGVNCYDPFNTCSGLDTQYCKQIDAGTFDGFDPPTDGGACEASADAADAADAAKDAADGGVKDAASDAPKDAAKDAPKEGG